MREITCYVLEYSNETFINEIQDYEIEIFKSFNIPLIKMSQENYKILKAK